MYYSDEVWKGMRDLLKPHNIHFLINYTDKTIVFYTDETVDEVLASLNGEPVVVKRSPSYTIGEGEIKAVLDGGIHESLVTRVKLGLLFSDSN